MDKSSLIKLLYSMDIPHSRHLHSKYKYSEKDRIMMQLSNFSSVIEKFAVELANNDKNQPAELLSSTF